MTEQGFDAALRHILNVEGGCCDVPGDNGGRTAYGITQETFNHYLGSHGQPARDVWGILPGETDAIYREIWVSSEADLLPWPLSIVVFDAFVNHGPGVARTLQADATWSDQPADREAFAMLCLRRNFYRRLAEKMPAGPKFIKGWLNRLEKLRLAAGL